MPERFDSGPPDERDGSASAAWRAARSRGRAVKAGIVRVGLGTVFLIGALAHALSPERHDRSSLLWMTTLLFLSTLNVAWGLRDIDRGRVRVPGPGGRGGLVGRGRPAWIFAMAAWSVLTLVLLGLLLRR